jgi:hypothetical protein
METREAIGWVPTVINVTNIIVTRKDEDSTLLSFRQAKSAPAVSLHGPRGQAENLIKLHEAGLPPIVPDCRSLLANQIWLILHIAVHIWLMLTVRDAIPKAHAQPTSSSPPIRLRLLKLGARIIEMASRVRIAFAAARPDATLIRYIAALMPTGPYKTGPSLPRQDQTQRRQTQRAITRPTIKGKSAFRRRRVVNRTG